MKKTLFSIVTLCLLLVSCGKKQSETETLSGLLPSKFEYRTNEGQTNQLYVMKNAHGMEVTVMNIGARMVSLVVPDKDGNHRNVVLGFDSIEPYLQPKNYYGAVLGRYANRIADATFVLDRVTYRIGQNEGKHQIHGGGSGFSSRYFTVEQPNEQSLVCSYLSKAGEEGFPGNLKLTVTYTLGEDNSFNMDYRATTDRATYINVSSHSYFNMSGAQANTIADQQLYMDADQYTLCREDLIPTGEIVKVPEVLNYTTLRPIDAAYPYDVNYVLNHPGNIDSLAVKVLSATTGIGMEIYTTEPGVQFYTDRQNPSYCLETQHFPDSPHQPGFPTTILRVDSVFNSKTIYKFTVNHE